MNTTSNIDRTPPGGSLPFPLPQDATPAPGSGKILKSSPVKRSDAHLAHRTHSGHGSASASDPVADAARRAEYQTRLQHTLAGQHPHAASRFDAGNGQGTVSGPPYGSRLQERPVLDGSTFDHEDEIRDREAVAATDESDV